MSLLNLLRRCGVWALARLENTFLARRSPLDLAMLRLILYGYVAVFETHRKFTWSTQRASFSPVGIYNWTGLISDHTLSLMQRVGQVAAIACCVGVGFRFAAPVCALALVYPMGLANNFGKINHPDNLLAVALVLLAFCRAGDGLSIDAWLRRRRGETFEASAEYRWPIAAIWLSVAGMYWAAGVAKVLHTGWEWAFSDNFQLLLLRHHFTHSPPTRVGIWIAQFPALCVALAVGALSWELLAPLLLLGGRWTLVFGGGLIGLQVGIFLLLGVAFRSMAPVFAAFLPWQLLAERLLPKRWLASAGAEPGPRPHE
ncbi:MAG TPA: HTTM domain-containing protein [Polyangiaceae bacterium]|jgi:hypothetical protein|nr:HTTM domain-containing protein [Polyangiaceae bacterium]